ncbi:MAG: aerotolerance regulator BatA, partial [Planctomycetia bacterium]
EIASITGGDVFSPGDPDGMKAVFARIDQMQQTRMEKTIPETFDHFQPSCLAGLSLLGISVLSLFGLRYTPW